MPKFLSEDEIVLVHNRLVEETGGLHGIRDRHAILSVVEQPRQVVFGKELYPTLYLKAAVYARSIIAHHPFLDGNKRTGISVATVFLADNGVSVDALEGEFFDLALAIVQEKWEHEAIAKWFRARTPAPRGKKRASKKR